VPVDALTIVTVSSIGSNGSGIWMRSVTVNVAPTPALVDGVTVSAVIG